MSRSSLRTRSRPPAGPEAGREMRTPLQEDHQGSHRRSYSAAIGASLRDVPEAAVNAALREAVVAIDASVPLGLPRLYSQARRQPSCRRADKHVGRIQSRRLRRPGKPSGRGRLAAESPCARRVGTDMWIFHPAVAWLWSAAGEMGGLIAPPGAHGSGGASLRPFAVAGSVICTSSPPSGLAWASASPPCALATDATMDRPSP